MQNRHQSMTGSFFYFIILPIIFCSNKSFSNCVLSNNTKVHAEDIQACEDKVSSMSKDCDDNNAQMILTQKIISDCKKKVMNKRIDIFLNRIKNTNHDLFKKEMQTQKYFNEGVIAYCGQYDKCEGTMFYSIQAGCYGDFYAYRANQIDKINENEFDVKEVKINENLNSISNYFNKYIENVCSLPSDYWKKKSIKSNCNRLIENELILMGVGSDVCKLDDE